MYSDMGKRSFNFTKSSIKVSKWHSGGKNVIKMFMKMLGYIPLNKEIHQFHQLEICLPLT